MAEGPLQRTRGFSTRLRALRKQRNLRQIDLASVLGLAQTTIANYEQNTRFPDEETLNRIVDYFDTSLDFLMGRTDRPGALAGPSGIGDAHGENGEEQAARLSPLAREYLAATTAGDTRGAERLVFAKLQQGMPVQALYREVFGPVLQEVGRRWEIAETEVYQEHVATEVTARLMSQIMRECRRSSDAKGSFLSVVSGGERHEIGLRMVTDVLELAGWQTIYLGTDVPTRNVLKAVADHHPHLVGISVTMEYNVDGAANLVASIRSHRGSRQVRIMVGGRAFRSDEQLWKRIGADAVGLSADTAVRVADRLLRLP